MPDLYSSRKDPLEVAVRPLVRVLDNCKLRRALASMEVKKMVDAPGACYECGEVLQSGSSGHACPRG